MNRAADPFCTTRWTVVLTARGHSAEGRAALNALCEAYYEPVLTFLTRSAGDAGAARELAHDFFANLLGGDRLAQVRREGGKFRAYLSGAVKHFVAHRRESERCLRRGGGIAPLSLEADDLPGLRLADEQALPPDLAFDRAWATTVLARALAALRAECDHDGRAAHFERLKPWLTGEAAHGAQAEMARELGLDAGALKAAVHRLKCRFRQLVKAEVASTLSPPADVEEEMRALFAALAP
jgi:DNA-directed RNA polymerase specialized sigma24 family protein